MMKTVFVLNKAQMGSGDESLGRKILAACLRKLVNSKDLAAIVFYNGGVNLVTQGSPVAVEIGLLRDKGVDLLACGTCVEHFGIKDQLLLDGVSNMDEILAAIAEADKVVTL